MKLPLLLLLVAGCFATPYLNRRQRTFREELNRLQEQYADFERERERELLSDISPRQETPETEAPETEAPETEETEAPETEAPEVSSEEVEERVGESSDVQATWEFNGDWSEAVTGSLVAGSSVLIVYDGARLPWRDTYHGLPAWSILAYYKFDDGNVQYNLLEGPEMIEGDEILTTKIFLPFGTTKLTMWFMHSGEYSGTHWDSNHGKNYEETVAPVEESTLVFEGDYAEHQYGGALEQGGKFQVYYSTERLEVGDGFKLYAAAKFIASSEEFTTNELKDPEDGYYVTEFDIPDDAEEVIMWFYTSKDDEHQYDSNYGANYHFPLNA